MEKDQIFRDEIQKVKDFKFDQHVATVFDDMVSRSVPYYDEMQRMMAEIALEYAQAGTWVYDLGCATGTTLLGLNSVLPTDVGLAGLDDSDEMLAKCRTKLEQIGLQRPLKLMSTDLNESCEIEHASVVVLCLTLQFVRPIHRERLLREVYTGLNPGGALLLIEKVLGEDSVTNRNFIKHYYDYKRRNHYTELEISQKREALENILIPYKLSENMTLLRDTGFGHAEVFFKWYNFTGILAVK